MNAISIQKVMGEERILLNWDGQIPPEAPANSVHTPDDVTHFWSHIHGFARWSKHAGAFAMDFSKQNIKRLHAQFGQIPIKTGQDRLAMLKAKQEILFNMAQTAMKVKELPIERLPTYEYKKPPLGEYQHRGVILMCNMKLVPLFADCGMGKTFMVLVSTERQIELGLIERGSTLVAAKLATLETGWLEDAAQFTGLKVVSLWAPQSRKKGYDRKAEIVRRLQEPADVYLINHDGLRIFKDELAAKKFQKVVIDESTILKGFHGMHKLIKGGQFGRALMEVAAHAEWRVVMSGTPAPNGPHDLWGQFYFLDPQGLLLEASYRDFNHEYMKILDLRGPNSKFVFHDGKRVLDSEGKPLIKPLRHGDPQKWIPKADTLDRISNIIKPFAYRLRIRDHLKDLPEETFNRRLIEMAPDQTKHYIDMEERLKVELGDTRITVPVKLAQIMKLRQITGGFIIDNEETPHAMPKNPKLDELDSLLEDEIDASLKVVIYCEYQWEVRTIEARYKHYGTVSVYGGNATPKNLANIKKFREDEKTRIIILHPKSAAHGVTFTVAHHLVFYSFSHSAEDNYQCVARIKRAGQKQPMSIYYFICKKSIDEDIYTTIQDKNRDQKKLIDPDELLIQTWQHHYQEEA